MIHPQMSRTGHVTQLEIDVLGNRCSVLGNWVRLPRVGVTVLLRHWESWALTDPLPFGRASKMVGRIMISSFNPHQSFVICFSIFFLAGTGALYCL